MKKNSKPFILLILASLCIVFLLNIHRAKRPPSLNGQHLIVYSSIRDFETQYLLDAFAKKYGCTYEYIQLPTEEAVNRILAEREKPTADIFISGTGDSLVELAKGNALYKYTSVDREDINPIFMDKYGYWTGFEFHKIGIVINKDLFEKDFKNSTYPTTFKDLLSPEFKGKIALPNPLTSGTGFNLLSSFYQNLSKPEFFDYITKLKANAGILTTRGFNVVQYVSSSEYPIGVAYINNIELLNDSVNNLAIITPKDTTWNIHGVGIIKNAPNLRISKAFVNFILSNEGEQTLKKCSSSITTKNYTVTNMMQFKNYNFSIGSKEKNTIFKDWKSITP